MGYIFLVYVDCMMHSNWHKNAMWHIGATKKYVEKYLRVREQVVLESENEHSQEGAAELE